MKKVIAFFLMLCFTMIFCACADNPETTTEVEIIEDLTKEAEGVMSYEQFQQLNEGDPVVLNVRVEKKISWEDYKAVIAVKDSEVSYVLTDVICSEDEFEQLLIGSIIRVTGYKGRPGDTEQIVDVVFKELEQ